MKDLNFSFDPYYALIIDAIAKNAHNLRCLTWCSRIATDKSSIKRILLHAKKLLSLGLNMFLEYGNHDVGPIHLPKLQTLLLITATYRDGDLAHVTNWWMLRLCSVWITSIYRTDEDDINFFRCHGGGLTFLELRYSSGDIGPLLALCGNLQQIVVNI